jgi:hypothetical protein
MIDPMKIGGVFTVEIERDGKVIDSFEYKNLVTTQGIKAFLDAGFGFVAAQPLYLSIYEGNVTPTSSLTMANYASTCTETTTYQDANRPSYVGVNTNNLVSNSESLAEFAMTANKNIYGAALVMGGSDKGGTTGRLISIRNFPSSKSLLIGDVLKIKFEFTAASA